MSAEYLTLPFDLPVLAAPLLSEEQEGQHHPKLRLVGGTAAELHAQAVTVTGRLTVSF